jgi:EmrB/QacA subfamily drug resistance transporter
MVLSTGMLMLTVDSTVASVALPSIQRGLGFSETGVAWVLNVYFIAFGGLLVLAGRLGDLVGRRRVFLAGLGLFTSVSLVCGMAGSQLLLIVARFVQGTGSALTASVILGMVISMFRDPHEQAKALGVYSCVISAGSSLGMVLGGVITQLIGWHWIFYINVPIGLITGLLAVVVVDPDGEVPGLKRDLDIAGGVLVTAGLMASVYAIVLAGERGWLATATVAWLVAAVGLLAAFVWRESTARQPLIPLRVLRSGTARIANGVQFLSVASLFGVFVDGVLLMQHALHFTPIGTGLAFLPMSLISGALSLGLSARLRRRFGTKPVLLVGLLCATASPVWLALAPPRASYVAYVLPALAILGAGSGLSYPALTAIAMADADHGDAGLASGLVNTVIEIGAAFGVAVLAAASASHGSGGAAHGAARAAALAGGYEPAWIAATVLAVLALATAVALLRAAPVPSRRSLPSSATAAIRGGSRPLRK